MHVIQRETESNSACVIQDTCTNRLQGSAPCSASHRYALFNESTTAKLYRAPVTGITLEVHYQ